MGSWVPSWVVYLAVACAGMLAHLRLHHALPAQARPVAGTMTMAMLGMFAGLAVDASHGRLELLASLCGGGLPLGLLLRWHLGLLAASNAALVLAGMLPMLWQARAGAPSACRRGLLPTLLCLGCMLAGMNLGMPLLVQAQGLRGGSPGLPAMLAAMQAGMSWGAAAALALLRAAARMPGLPAKAASPRS